VQAEKRGVLFQPGAVFSETRARSQHARLGYGCLNEAEMRDAIARLDKAMQAARR